MLPRPWFANATTRTFFRGPGGSVGFSWALSSAHGGGGGGHHPYGTTCPGTFQVLHNDRIGTFAVPKGNYAITLLAARRLSCAKASSYFARFLQDFDGVLPRPWIVDRGDRLVPARLAQRGLPHQAARRPAELPAAGAAARIRPVTAAPAPSRC